MASAMLIFLGIAGPAYYENKLRRQIDSQVIISSYSSPRYKIHSYLCNSYVEWQNNVEEGSSFTISKFYIFNVTNPEQILAGETPQVAEVQLFTLLNKGWSLCLSNVLPTF